jgi:hypothetical protein
MSEAVIALMKNRVNYFGKGVKGQSRETRVDTSARPCERGQKTSSS